MKIINYKNLAKPSNILRNFATEVATWSNLGALQQRIGNADDASFFIDFEWLSVTQSNQRILYITAASGRFSVYNYSDGRVIIYTNLLGGSSYVAITLLDTGDGLPPGRHTISARVSGTVFYAKLDDNAELLTSGSRLTSPSFSNPVSDAEMYIYGAWERNDTANEIVWSYPSMPEHLRLVIYTNVRTDRGVFEAAASALGWSIKTALPAGIAGTVLAKINGAVVTDPPQWDRTTSTFTGLSTDKLEWLSVFTETLSENKIMYLNLK